MAWTKEEMDAAQAAYGVGSSLSLGGPAGNPGYSEAAPVYNEQTGKYEGGGTIWVGAPGGDTPENRAIYAASTGGTVGAFDFLDESPVYSLDGKTQEQRVTAPDPRLSAPTSGGGGTATDAEFYAWLDSPEGREWAAANGYDVPVNPGNKIGEWEPQWTPEWEPTWSPGGNDTSDEDFYIWLDSPEGREWYGRQTLDETGKPIPPNGVPIPPNGVSDADFYTWLNTDAGQDWYDDQNTDTGFDFEAMNDRLSLGGIQSDPDHVAADAPVFNFETGEYEDGGPNPNYSYDRLTQAQRIAKFAGDQGTNVAPIGENSMIESLRPDLIGYESSSNKDFYQQQFQDMRTQEASNDFREDNARALAAKPQSTRGTATDEEFYTWLNTDEGRDWYANDYTPGENANNNFTDPWAWADLPEVQIGTGQPDSLGTQIGLNQNYNWGPGTSNTDIISSLSGSLGGDALDYLNKNNNLSDAPSFLDQSAFGDYVQNDNPNDSGYGKALNKLYNQVWTPQGTSAPGANVPVGYASPLSK